MDIRNRRALKSAAAERLGQAAYSPRKLALLHTAISLGAAFLIALVDFYLSHQIESTGGLSGMGMRSMLGTVQTTLQYALQLVLPFWEMGFVYASLQWARGERAEFSSLTEGFRRFGAVLRLRLLETFLYFGAAIACVYLSSMIFMSTSFSLPMMEEMMPLMENGTIEEIQQAIVEMPLEKMTSMMAPFFVIFGVLFLVVAVLFFYRFRMASFIVMDQPKIGGLFALVASRRMTRRRRWALLKLDLSFWWYYLLLALATAVCYGDALLRFAGVTLPISEEVAWFGFYLLGMLVQLAVCWYGYSYVQTTYATAYAQAELPIPAYGTTHADYFHGDIPCTRRLTEQEVAGDYEKNTGLVMAETLGKRDPMEIPAMLVASHGPFAWGKNADEAVYHAVVLEEIARMALLTESIRPDVKRADAYLLDKHYLRKHGKNAYYGQK